jgi:hypothetical protein
MIQFLPDFKTVEIPDNKTSNIECKFRKVARKLHPSGIVMPKNYRAGTAPLTPSNGNAQ